MKLKKITLLLLFTIVISCDSRKFTTADGRELKISSLIGKNVFDMAYEYSKVSPETLTGTNNQRWVVYYSDINVTLEVNKSTKIVRRVSKGKEFK